MKLQSWRRVLLTGTALAMFASSAACKPPSETEKYAQQLNLPKEVITIVRPLELFYPNTKSLLENLSYMPKEIQVHEETLNYLKHIVKDDNKISDSGLGGLKKLDHDGDKMDLDMEKEFKTNPLKPEPEVKQTVDSLKSVSNDLYKVYLNLGIDSNVAQYVSFVSTLPKDFSDYALRQRLCIQDKQLTETEKNFLKDPNKYTQQIYEYNISEISKIDPELVNKLKTIPFLKEVELKDVEATEDVLYLATFPEGKVALEKIYGKGIERKMHPVALEKLIWDSYSNELNISDLRIHLRLANFQERYNKEMDVEGVAGPKPAIRGMNYFEEPHGYIRKNENDIRFDYALMRWVLRSNAIRLWGYDDYAFYHIKLAQDEDLDIWLQYSPFFSYPDMDLEDYKKQLSNFAKKAQDYKVDVLFVGNELDLWSKQIGGTAWTANPEAGYGKEGITKFIDELVNVARQNFSNKLTYADYWPPRKLNWCKMDIVSLNTYIWKGVSNQEFIDWILTTKNRDAISFSKPFIMSEIGSQTITEWSEPLKLDTLG